MNPDPPTGNDRPASSRWASALVAVPALAAFVWTIWRTATLSLTFDEATTFTQFVHPSVDSLFIYSTNNHVLNSWLMKLTTTLLGPSQLALRLPALLGAGLYLGAMARLCRLVFARWPEQLLVAALLSWNPLLLDFFCLARGYSLALGFLALTLLFLTKYLRPDGHRISQLIVASVALALSASSQWSFLFVETFLVIGFLFLLGLRAGGIGRWLKPAAALTLPGLIVAGAILGRYTQRMMHEPHFFGFSTTPADSVRDLINATFFRLETAVRNQADLRTLPRLHVATDQTQQWVMDTGVPLLIIATLLLFAAVLVFSIPLLKGAVPGQLAWLCGFSLAGNWVALEGSRYARDVLFPQDRMFIYVTPLMVLLLSSLAFSLLPLGARWLFGIGATAVLLLGLRQADPRFTRSWLFNEEARGFFQFLKTQHAANPQQHIRLGGAWLYAPPFDLYRQAEDAYWLSTYEIMAQPGDLSEDYYVFHPKDVPPRALQRLRVVAEDPVSGTQLGQKIAP